MDDYDKKVRILRTFSVKSMLKSLAGAIEYTSNPCILQLFKH